MLWSLGLLLAIVVTSAVVGCCAFSAPRYGGPASAHFDGARFRNRDSTEHGGFGDVLRWMWSRYPGPGRTGPMPRREPHRLGAWRPASFNHATVLVQMDGVNILTDPIWSDRLRIPVDLGAESGVM